MKLNYAAIGKVMTRPLERKAIGAPTLHIPPATEFSLPHDVSLSPFSPEAAVQNRLGYASQAQMTGPFDVMATGVPRAGQRNNANQKVTLFRDAPRCADFYGGLPLEYSKVTSPSYTDPLTGRKIETHAVIREINSLDGGPFQTILLEPKTKTTRAGSTMIPTHR